MKTNTLSLSYHLPQSDNTQKLAAQMALLCPSQCVIFLKGPLGGGKTTFARGFIQQLGDVKRIKSPTYTLVETYRLPHRYILHFDLYRLQSPLELEAIGIRDYTLASAIWLIEWPERAMQADQSIILPEPDLILSFSLKSDSHALEITSHSKKADAILTQLKGCQI